MSSNHDDQLSALLAERRVLVADGGMGTSLFAMGMRPGATPELWNVENPEAIASVHLGYIEAGADIILSNTFGGTRTRLDLDGLGERVGELNAAGVAVARRVAEEAGRKVLVAGSVGPTGALFSPLGPMTSEEATAIFAEQIEALAGAGCDIIWIETMSSLEELSAAHAAAAGAGLPIVTTMSFDTNGRTMMGVAPVEITRWWQDHEPRAAAVGANCGVGPADVVLAVAEMYEGEPKPAIVAKTNCGVPQIIDGQLWYPASSDEMSGYAELALDAGATIIGACCGSVPDHIRQIRAVVDDYQPRAGIERADVERRLGSVSRPVERKEERRRRRASAAGAN